MQLFMAKTTIDAHYHDDHDGRDDNNAQIYVGSRRINVYERVVRAMSVRD